MPLVYKAHEKPEHQHTSPASAGLERPSDVDFSVIPRDGVCLGVFNGLDVDGAGENGNQHSGSVATGAI